MGRIIRRGWSIWLAAGICGCQGLFGSQGLPADPLLTSRKPLEAKAGTAAPMAVAYVEPSMPANPAAAMASKKKNTPDPSTQNVPGILTGRQPEKQKEK